MDMIYYFAALLAAFTISAVMMVQKNYQKHYGDTMKAGFRFNIALGAATMLVFIFVVGKGIDISPFSLLMAFLMALFVMLYTVLGFQLMKGGAIAVYSIFLMSGGMTVPYVFGLIFLGEAENFKPLSLVGLLLILAGCVLSAGSAKLTEKKYIPLCIAVFLLNGCTSVVSKLHSVADSNWGITTVSDVNFVFWCGAAKIVIGAAALLVIRAISKKRPTETAPAVPADALPMNKWILRIALTAVIAAAIDGFSYWLQLVIAGKVPATMQYPLVTGGSIIFTALLGWGLLREKPSRRVTASILLCMIGICMFI